MTRRGSRARRRTTATRSPQRAAPRLWRGAAHLWVRRPPSFRSLFDRSGCPGDRHAAGVGDADVARDGALAAVLERNLRLDPALGGAAVEGVDQRRVAPGDK